MSKMEELLEDYCPDGVEYKKIKEVADCIAGATPSKTKYEYWENGTIPWLSSGEVNKVEIFDTDTKITQLGYDNSSTKMVPENTVVIALAGQGKTRGTVAITHLSLCTNQSLCSIVTKDELNPRFLFHYLRGQYGNLRKLSSGDGGRGGLNLKIIGNIEIPVPPLPVQEEIVRILDMFTLTKNCIIKKLTDELNIREKQYVCVEEKILSNHEQSFPSKSIGSLADTFIGLATSTTKWKTNSGVLLLHNSDIQPGKIVLKQREYLNPEFVKKFPKKVHKLGDIITVHTGAVGTSAIITSEYEGTIGFTTIVTRLKENSDVTAEYLCQFLNSGVCKEQINGKTISERNNLNLKKFNEIYIPVPSKKEQLKISNLLIRNRETFNLIKANLENEIKARQKQYEYYRDKLLTFKRKA